jgi:TrmH family RNA methyltransferase
VKPDDHRALVVGRVALDRLANARVVATIDEAAADCSYVVGFSARRGGDRPMVGLRNLPGLLTQRAPSGKIAIVFGPEDTGLVSADIDRCDAVCAIDTPGTLASFNLTQAVAIALWELSRPAATIEAQPARRGGATRAEIDALLDHAFEALDAIGYLRTGDREQKRVHLRRLLGNAALSSDDVRGLHGISAQVLYALAQGRSPSSD